MTHFLAKITLPQQPAGRRAPRPGGGRQAHPRALGRDPIAFLRPSIANAAASRGIGSYSVSLLNLTDMFIEKKAIDGSLLGTEIQCLNMLLAM